MAKWVAWIESNGNYYLSIFEGKPGSSREQVLSKIIHSVEMSPSHIGLTYEQLKEKYPLPTKDKP